MTRPDERNQKAWSVVHMTSVHQPFDTRIFVKQCSSLARSGHQVALIACRGQDEDVNGVRILGIARPGNRLLRMVMTPFAVLRRALSSRAAICHFHDPELIPVGIALKLMGRRVIYDVHEDLPKQITAKEWLHPLLRRPVAAIAGLVEWLAGRSLDHIIAATPAIAEKFPARKTTLVQNFPMADELSPAEPIPYNQRPRAVAYIGGVSRIRGAQEMIDAFGALQDTSVRLKLAGPFQSPGLQAELQASPGWGMTDYLGVLDREHVRTTLSACRVGLVTFLPSPNHMMAYPNKMFEYMAAGVPVIASDFPLWRSIVEGAGAGLLVDPRRPEAIAAAVRWLIANERAAAEMGQRGREAVLEKFSWRSEERKLLHLYETLAAV